MTTIKLHNTRTRKKEVFTPLDPENVRMYVCGPTVYDRAHLGNARPVVVFDVLYRLLRHVYGPDHVTYVRNFTDVDDKINARAAESGREIGEITAETTQWFLDDMAALGALEPDHMPRATQYIPQMVAMIEGLIAKGHAYEAEGHVLFAVDSWREGYGKLSGRSVDDMIAGARVEVAPYKRNPMDFVLWKPSDAGQPGWESPWGRGRPGWHIECSAMAYELLGESFDIHGGGNDLMFPHHENEIAQSCCAHPEGEFARYWLHNEMLQVEGKKMSKSLGNFFTVRDLLDQGIPGEVIRFVFLSTHYRKPMDWTAEKARQAADLLHSWRLQTEFVEPSKPSKKIIAALSDDLNTWEAIEELKKLASRKDAPTLKASANLMGLLEDIHGAWSWKMRPGKDFNNLPAWHPANAWFREVMRPIAQVAEQLRMTFSDIPKIQMPKLNINVEAFSADLQESMRGVKQLFDYQNRISSEYPEEIATVSDEMPFVLLTIDNLDAVQRIGIASYISKRNLAKASRDYQLADEIRSELAEVGIYLEDTPEGTKWSLASDFHPAKLEALK